MKIGIIVGSHRNPSNSAKVGRYISEAVKRLVPASSVWTFDLGGNPLPLWDESIWAADPEWKKRWEPISKELRTSDGFVVVSPEYSGMVPAGLKNFFLLCSANDIGHKPGLIVGVSSGRGGSYPVAELRMSSYKNTRINWIPEHVIVRDADHVLVDSSSSEEADRLVRSRLDYGVRLLAEYAKAMRPIRSSGVIDDQNFPHGM